MTQPNNYTLAVDGPAAVELVRRSLRSVIDLLDVQEVEVSIGVEGSTADLRTEGDNPIDRAATILNTVELGDGPPESIIITLGGEQATEPEADEDAAEPEPDEPDAPGRIQRPHTIEHIVLHELHYLAPESDERLTAEELGEQSEHDLLTRARAHPALSRLKKKGLVDTETRSTEGGGWEYAYSPTVAGVHELDRLEEADAEKAKQRTPSLAAERSTT